MRRLCAALHVQVCKQVPTGKVSTYSALAKVLGSSPRAVGQVQMLMLPMLHHAVLLTSAL